MLELYKDFKEKLSKGKLEEFRRHVIENNLLGELVQDGFTLTFGAIDPEEEKTMEALSLFELKLLRDEYGEKLGSGLTDKFSSIIIQEEYTRKKLRDLRDFMVIGNAIKGPDEVQLINQVIDVASNPDMVIGTHITGTEIGDIISREGILLTGHKFAVNNDIDYKNIKSSLRRNVSFFENDPLGVISSLLESRHYNNPQGEFNHVMLVSIPKDELSNNNPDIIRTKDGNNYLNPEYINGYFEVGVNSGRIEGFKNNPGFIEKTQQAYEPQSAVELTVQDWENKFENWYEEANQNKFQRLTSKVMNFFRNVLKKDRNQKQIADHSVDMDDRG